MKRLKIIFAVLPALLCLPLTVAAEVSLSARIEPSVVPIGAQATLIVTVKGKFRKSSQPELPSLDAFEVYQSGSSQSFSIVNGQRSSSLIFTYVLVPKMEGRYTISPIRFQSDDKVYTAAPLSVEVVKAQSSLPAPTPDPANVDSNDAPIFIRGTVDRDTVYVNQQLTWTLGFYTDGRLDLLRSPEYSPPNSQGFWVEDLPPQKNGYQMINGRKYLVNEILRGFFATAPGEFEIGAAKVEIVVDNMGGRSAMDQFFNMRQLGFGKQRTLTTEPKRIIVLPLPQRGRPDSFSGLVGRGLAIAMKMDKETVRAGEPVNVTLTVTGDGNFKTMAAPKIPEIEGFKMYESGSTSELFKSDYVVSGRKITNIVLVPRDEGETEIPPVKLSYFDPYEKRYRTIESAPLKLRVEPGAQGEGGTPVVFTGSGEDIEVLGHDIHHIHPTPADIAVSGTPFYERRYYVALHSLPMLVVALTLLVERRRRRWLADAPRARMIRAKREADKQLGAASDMIRSGNVEQAFAAVSAALRGYIADKMNASAPGLTDDDIETFLADRGVPDEARREVVSVLAVCDGARYSASATSPEAATGTYARAQAVVAKLEKELS